MSEEISGIVSRRCLLFILHVFTVPVVVLAHVVLLQVALVQIAQAQTPQSQQPFLSLNVYPHARELFQTQVHNDDYRLTLGVLEKINNVWRAEHEQRLAGMVKTETLELPQGHSAAEAYDFYLKQIQAYSARELFSCRARDCGSSNSWANNRFRVKQLYGLDQYQRYGVYELQGEGVYYVTLYAVTRGNKRAYLQLETLQPDGPSGQSIAASRETIRLSLKEKGYYQLPQVSANDGRIVVPASHLQSVVETLKKNRSLNVWIVGHDYSQAAVEKSVALSKSYAAQLQEMLVSEGVAAKRLQSQGVGRLAPLGRSDEAVRLFLVIAP